MKLGGGLRALTLSSGSIVVVGLVKISKLLKVPVTIILYSPASVELVG